MSTVPAELPDQPVPADLAVEPEGVHDDDPAGSARKEAAGYRRRRRWGASLLEPSRVQVSRSNWCIRTSWGVARLLPGSDRDALDLGDELLPDIGLLASGERTKALRSTVVAWVNVKYSGTSHDP